MKALVADNGLIEWRLLQRLLEDWAYTVSTCTDGVIAWEVLQWKVAPIDSSRLGDISYGWPWGMSEAAIGRSVVPLLDSVTSQDQHVDIAAGLQVGANEYLIRQFNHDEFQARAQAGVCMIALP